jgi:hypothetical protein
MPATYEPIATQTGNGSATTITFISIPQTYTDLVLVMPIFTASNANESVQINGDTGSNYSNTWITGNGSSAASSRNTSNTALNIQANIFSTSTSPAFHIMNFQNYSNTTTFKTVLTRSNRAEQATEAFVGLWRNTAAITSISIASATFTTNATFTLYGIKAA